MTRVASVEASTERSARADPFFAWVAAGTVLLSTIQVAVLAASLSSLRLSRAVAAAILIAALLAARLVWRGLAAGEARQRSRDREGAVGIALERGQPLPHGRGSAVLPWGRPLASAFLAFYAFLFVAAAVVPDVSWDGNSYHLPVVQQWFQRGQVVWVEGPDTTTLRHMNGYPKTAEVLSFFLATLVHPALANTFNLVYLPLGILGIASIACALGASRPAALTAGAALLLVPINLGQSPTAYVDSSFGSAVIAWLAATVALRRLDPQRSALQALVLGCALGQVIGTKGTGLVPAAVGSLALAAVHVCGGELRRPARLAAWWLGVGACALLVGGFWYARNLLHGQSPLYPVGVFVAGYTLYPGYEAYAPTGAFATDGWLADWPQPARVAIAWLQGLRHWPQSIVGFDMRLGGLGFLWLVGCLPAVFALVRRRSRLRTDWRDEVVREPLWLLLAVTAASFALVPCPWWSRYTIWIYGLGLPCLAALAPSLRGRPGRVWLSTCAAIAVVEAGIVIARWQVPLLGLALRNEPPDAKGPGPAVRIPTHFYPPWVLRGSLLRRLARGDDRVGIGPLDWHQEPVVGVLSQPIGGRDIHFAPDVLAADFADWYARVRPRYLVLNKTADLPPAVAALQPQVHQTPSLTVLQFW